ncbi:exodeoxyribonuclease VII large subunit, partial [Clostridium polynesiense]|uniref:exodeoxyribonuclease VII large subunit n=1 Tax=Clostridium polynesiense TaxID=1325933 RepID=UPI00059107DD
QAAEIAVMPQEELFREVFELKEELHENINEFISEGNRMLELYKRTLENYNPMNYIVHRYSEVDNCYDKLKGIIANKINKGYLDLEGYKNLLDAYNPLNVLNKGYSVVYQRNKIIKSVEDYEIDKETTLRFYNGTVNGKFIAAEKEIE